MNQEPCRRVLEFVRELHLRGYERLRIAPGMSASGLYWRCAITPLSNISPENGARIKDYDGLAAHYSSADGNAFFGWPEAARGTPSELADIFIEAFPAIVAAGRAEDPAYVEWYRAMLEATGADTFPIAYADWDLPEDHLPTVGARELKLALPPPPLNNMFDEAISLIESEYPRLGHNLGWRFLYTPKSTLSSKAEVVFFGLNPGGGQDEGVQVSCESGNAYLVEGWDHGRPNRLQKQVRAFYQLVADAWRCSRDELMNKSLAANLWPFRSREFLSSEAGSAEANRFIKHLWAPVLAEIRPKVLVTMGGFTTRRIHEILRSRCDIADEKSERTGWGNVTYGLARAISSNGTTLLIALPHLSRFAIFNRSGGESFDALIEAIQDIRDDR
ncbi:MAG: hypothetical protein QOE70_1595 [Chthoniobacter sp.]|jgi:hypothetical protein|nr:hypothetical protein [Chthoniobacter sp.]